MKIRDDNLFKISNCLLIAEIGVNHNNDMDIAAKLIDAAKHSGADAVKFQTFTAESLVSYDTPKLEYQKKTSPIDESHYDMIKKLELKREDHIRLKEYSEKQGLIFLSTPYDIDSACFLNDTLDVLLFKTSSADIVDLPLQRYIASTGKPSIISVGMASLGEIEEVVKLYKDENNSHLALLHCVSNYPCADASLNLNVINTLKQAFQLPVGYSDHSLGLEAAVISVALGAKIIEKHFTLDKSLPGPDHLASSTPCEFSALAMSVRRAEKMLGSPVKECQEEERHMKIVSRKSIVMSRSLQAGEVIRPEDLALKRPGTGLLAREIENLVGRRTVREIKKGRQIFFSDIQ